MCNSSPRSLCWLESPAESTGTRQRLRSGASGCGRVDPNVAENPSLLVLVVALVLDIFRKIRGRRREEDEDDCCFQTSRLVNPNVAENPSLLVLVVVLVLDIFRKIRGRRRGRGRGRLLFSDFTFGELWQRPAIIPFVQQSKGETDNERFKLCNWRVQSGGQPRRGIRRAGPDARACGPCLPCARPASLPSRSPNGVPKPTERPSPRRAP